MRARCVAPFLAAAVPLALAWTAWAADPLPVATNNGPAAGTEIVHPGDGALMVWVPAGPFLMGLNADRAAEVAKSLQVADYHTIAAEEWAPQHTRLVDGFFIDMYEVTYQLWNRYTNEAGYKATQAKGPPQALAGALDLYPVASVTWAEAQQYANWYGKRLPTEEQWEKAARGTDGRIYPWGNEFPTRDRGNFPGEPTGAWPRPVGTYPAGISPYGCLDMSGNMYEWTADWFEPYPNNPEYKRMLSYMGHTFAVLRGGSFYHAWHALGCAKRFGFKPSETYYHVGFRTVWVPPDGYFASPAFPRDAARVPERRKEIESLRRRMPPLPPPWT